MRKIIERINIIILHSIVSFVVTADALSETYTVESVFASLRAKYSSMKTVELEFQSVEPVSGMVGSLQAADRLLKLFLNNTSHWIDHYTQLTGYSSYL